MSTLAQDLAAQLVADKVEAEFVPAALVAFASRLPDGGALKRRLGDDEDEKERWTSTIRAEMGAPERTAADSRGDEAYERLEDVGLDLASLVTGVDVASDSLEAVAECSRRAVDVIDRAKPLVLRDPESRGSMRRCLQQFIGAFLARLKLAPGDDPPAEEWRTGGMIGVYGALLIVEDVEANHALALFAASEHAGLAVQVLGFLRAVASVLVDPGHRATAFDEFAFPLLINAAIAYDAAASPSNYLRFVLCVREASALATDASIDRQTSLDAIDRAFVAVSVPQPVIDRLVAVHVKKQRRKVPADPHRILTAAHDYFRSASADVIHTMIAHFRRADAASS